MNRVQIITGDCRQALKELPSGSMHCCVTSPPYWGLRDYGHPDQIGQERTPEEYVETMVQVFREVKRVLRQDGTLWLNLGDSYSSGSGGYDDKYQGGFVGREDIKSKVLKGVTPDSALIGLKPKNLIGIPWRVAFALQADGWYLRSDIIWHKPNPMPESVTDRPTKSHEYLFLMSKSERYFYDSEAIKETAAAGWNGSSFTDDRDVATKPGLGMKPRQFGATNQVGTNRGDIGRTFIDNGTRNKRSVWTVPTSPYSEAHFATFPPDLIKPCILAGTSAKGCCPKCGSPWERVLDSEKFKVSDSPRSSGNGDRNDSEDGWFQTVSKTVGWRPTCDCFLSPEKVQTEPCTVLDPFGGSGTTGQVALELGRKAILIELNPKYVTLIENRTHVTPGLPLA